MITAKDIMTSEVITVGPETSVSSLAKTLWENRISGAPVVDADGKLLAVVTENDLIDQAKRVHIPTMITLLDSVIFLEKEKKMKEDIDKITGRTVGDICAKQLITVSTDTPLDEIATIMAEKKVHTLPVVDDGKLVGVLGKTDIIRTLTR